MFSVLSLLNRFHKDEYFHYHNSEGYSHRSPVKSILNPVLRAVQFWSNRPYVIATDVDFMDDPKIAPLARVTFVGYVFCREGIICESENAWTKIVKK